MSANLTPVLASLLTQTIRPSGGSTVDSARVLTDFEFSNTPERREYRRVRGSRGPAESH